MHRGTILLAIGLAGCARASQPSSSTPSAPIKHTLILAGARAGTQSAVKRADGTWVVDWEYNDRGRGPRLHTEMALDERGLPVSLHTTGNDYLKGPVDETLSAAGGELRWKNKAEQGSAAADAGFYVSMYGPPLEGAFLASAALRAPGGRLKVLPVGEVVARQVDRMTVSAGDRSEEVQLIQVDGLYFTPFFLWLRGDGSLFGSVSPWLSVLPEGWEAAHKPLLERQETRMAARNADVAARLAHPPLAGVFAIRGVSLFDSERAVVRPGTTILVRGDRIERVGPDGSFPIPDGAELIDGTGRTAVPGLWDMHVHIGADDGLLHIAAGVTSARDLANDIDAVMDIRRRIDGGTLIGPRLILAGFIDGPGPYAGPTKVLVDTEAEARAAVDRYADLGYAQIKIYSSVKPELVPIIAEHAHKRRMRVSGHIPAHMSAEQAVKAGYDEIQHINMLVLNFLPDVKDTRTPLRFTAPGERAASIDLGSAEVRAFVDLLRSRGTVVDPTLETFEGMFNTPAGQVAAGLAPVADRLPAQVRRSLLGGGLPNAGSEQYVRSYKRMIEMVGLLVRSGVTIVAGTDDMAGFALHRELELYVQAGIEPPKVLQLATLGAARVMGKDRELGSITQGKLADFILIPGDPTRDISAVRAVETVFKAGRRYSVAELCAEIGVRPVAPP
jgi:imidazolonepropionase-like amidohydrolase